jgi:trk system potassium uptake protein TrkA
MRVAIAGAGNVGTYIAGDLHEGGHEVLLIEQDPDVVARVRAAMPEITVAEADACEVASLQRLELDTYDVMVGATGDDEDNLVNHPQNQWLFNESWGVDISVSTPHLLTALVEEAVAVGSLVRLMQFGNAQLVEVTLAEGSPAVGKAISELGVPRDATIVAVIRGDRHVVVPRGETVMELGDEILVLVMTEATETVKALLIGAPAARSASGAAAGAAG